MGSNITSTGMGIRVGSGITSSSDMGISVAGDINGNTAGIQASNIIATSDTSGIGINITNGISAKNGIGINITNGISAKTGIDIYGDITANDIGIYVKGAITSDTAI